jgi:hypothetical protein
MSAHYFPPQSGSGGGGGSEFWGDAVATFGDLPPAGAVVGEVRFVMDTKTLYEWDGTDWVAFGFFGPGSSTDNAVVRWDGTTGTFVKDSGVILDDSNNITGITDIEITGTTTIDTALSGPLRASSGVVGVGDTDLATEVTGVLPVANGGTNSSTALANDLVIVSVAGAIVESTITTTELDTLDGIASNIQDQLDAKADDTGTANRLAIFDNAGNFGTTNKLALGATFVGLDLSEQLQVVNADGGNLHQFNQQVNPTINAPDTSRTNISISTGIDTNDDGFDLGQNGNAVRNLFSNITHGNKSDTGGLEHFQMQCSIGNGTDAITVEGMSWVMGFGGFNANVTIDGPLQGYGFQPNTNASTVMTANAYVNAFYDFANIQSPSLAGYTSFNAGPNIATVPNNNQYVGVNISPNITAFTGSASVNGVSISGNYPAMNANSGWNGVNVNPNIASARYAAGINVTMDNVTPYAGVQSTLTIQDLTFTWINPGDNNAYTIEYTGGGTAGSEVVTLLGQAISCQIESGVSTANQIKTAFDASGGFNANINTTVSGTGTNTQVTAAAANFVNGENAGNIYAAYFDGKVAITGALEFNGDFQCARFDAFRQYTLTDGGGQPSSGHSIVTSPTVAANVTVANADTLGVNTAALFNIGDNAVVTTAFLGLSALGLPAVLTMGTGATVDRISGAVFALSLDASAGGGTVDIVSLCRSIAIPNGATTVNRLYGYEFDLPFGDPGTVSWGLYLAPDVNNWIKGSLKIGGTASSDDTVANSSVALEVTDKAVLFASLTTAQRDALTAIDGMQIYNTDDDEMQAYQNGAWGPMSGGGGGMATTAVSAISANTTLADKITYLVDSSGGALTLTLPPSISGGYIVVKDAGNDALANPITILADGAETIDFVSSYEISEDLVSVTFVGDGNNWFVI